MRGKAPATSHAIATGFRVSRAHRNVACKVNPELMQDIIVGGAVATAVSAAVYNGLKADTVQICDLCQGVGAQPSNCS